LDKNQMLHNKDYNNRKKAVGKNSKIGDVVCGKKLKALLRDSSHKFQELAA